ncbi:MAG: tRNA (adenosine(37)-N6)-threonylcarbamoyltransferase complex dimerization subunit type 1 TsaB [Symbiobacteriia bacterium]
MRLVAIDTATAVCAVALMEDGQCVVEKSPELVRTHSQWLVPLLDEALADAGWGRRDIEAVAVGEGPGSFTGVRIGLSSAKAIAFALGVPLVTVGTLEAIALSTLLPPADMAAAQAAASGPQVGDLVCPLLDARRGEVYTALYRVVAPAELRQERPPVSPTLSVWLAELPIEGRLWFTGEGVQAYRPQLLEEAARGRRISAQATLRALAVGLLGQREVLAGRTVVPDAAVPLYVRRSQAEVVWEQRQGGPTC